MYTFKVIETWEPLAHGVSYGIVADDGKGRAAVVPGVSCDRDFVTRLAERCARGQLDPEQLLDVVMDALLL